MADEPGGESGYDQTENLIDDLIRDILDDSARLGMGGTRSRSPLAAMVESALMRGSAGGSQLERLLLAHAVATSLSEALAPALAEALAPEIIRALENYARDKLSGSTPSQAQRSTSAKESEAKRK